MSGAADEATPDARQTAALLQGVVRRTLEEHPLRRHGDELDLVDRTLSMWNQVPVDDLMHIHALTALITGFLPALVLTESVEAMHHQTSFDAAGATEALGRLGVASWCAALGYPLEREGEAPAASQGPAEPLSPLEAFSLVREVREAPQPSEELEAHEAFDSAVQPLLPTFRRILERVEQGQTLAEVREGVRDLSLALLAMTRGVGSVVFPAISWSGPDIEGAEGWWSYYFATVFVALNLRVLAERDSPEAATAGLHFDSEVLDMVAARFERPDDVQ